MIIDYFKTLVMEHCGYPGNIGDSCAETSRAKHLRSLLGENNSALELSPFVSDTGFLRHPNAPERDDKGVSWRETDFSSDQALPLFVASKKCNPEIAQLMLTRLKANWYKTGNGDFVHPIFLGLLLNKSWIINICILGQGLLFKMPWRWNEAYNRFEEMKESSADYLNYIHAGVYSNKLCRKLISKSTLKAKVRDYYKVEPNCEWLIDLYDRVIDKYW